MTYSYAFDLKILFSFATAAKILHGVGGGTGAGLTGLLIERLKDEFMEKMIMSFSVLPSPKVGSYFFVCILRSGNSENVSYLGCE